jgi:hypothetical protein
MQKWMSSLGGGQYRRNVPGLVMAGRARTIAAPSGIPQAWHHPAKLRGGTPCGGRSSHQCLCACPGYWLAWGSLVAARYRAL